MGVILNNLERQLTICQQEKEEAKAKADEKFWELISTAPPKITKVFQRLVLFKHKAYPQPPIVSVNPTNKEVFNIKVLKGKWVLFYISSLDNVSDQDISCLKEVYEGIEKHNKCVIVWIPVVEDWTEGREEQFKEWRSKMPWYAVQYFSPPAIGYLEQLWNFKGNPMVVVMNWKGKVEISNIIDLIRTQAIEAIALLKFWELISTAHTKTGPLKITEVFQTLVLFKHKAYPQPPIISVDPANKEVFNISVLVAKWVLFYISSLDNVSDQDISCLKEVYEGIEKHNNCVFVWIPVVEDWTEGGEEQFKEWRSKMPWYAVQYFSPPAIGYLEQRWNFKGNPMVVVMDWEGEVAFSNIINLIRTQATKAIALLNVKMQKEIRLWEDPLAKSAKTAEAVVELKCLICPWQITNTEATPVLLDGSNKQVDIDKELKWKDLFLLLSDVGIEDCYISYLKPVYEGIRRYPSPSYGIVWVPVVEQWNQDKEKQLEMSRLKMPWYTLKCFLTKPAIQNMKEKWNYKGKPAVVVMTREGMVKNKNAFPLIKKRGMDAFSLFK